MLKRGLLIVLVFFSLFLCPVSAATDEIPPSCRQLVVAVADHWNASRGMLQRFAKMDRKWSAVGDPVPVLLGRNGLAWGRGVGTFPQVPRVKHEGDGCAPAGIFQIGKIYGYEPTLPQGSDYPYHQVDRTDAWIDDPEHPQYNQHVRVDPDNPPAWFPKQKMRHGDFAYHWLVEVRHNADPPVASFGSAIFFHIRRGPNRATSGCTAMTKSNLEAMIRWLRAEKNPHYVLLPRSVYQELHQQWQLPAW